MKVLVLTTWWPDSPDGASFSFVRDQALAMLGAGADVRVSVLHRRRFPLEPWSAPIAPFSGSRRLAKVRAPVVPERWLFEACHRSLADLVMRGIRAHGRWARDCILLAHTQLLARAVGSAACRQRVPWALITHGEEPDSPRYTHPARFRDYARALAAADAVVAVGPRLAERLAQEVPDARVRTVLNGYDEGLVARVLAEPGRRADGPRLATVANLVPGKGVGIVVEALGVLKGLGRPVPLYDIVGDGPERSALERRVRALGLDMVVRFHGALGRAATLRIVRGATGFLLPSAPEACGIAILEAMGLGVAPVAARGEGPDSYIQDGRNGLLVERTTEGLLRALEVLLGPGSLACRIGQEALRDAATLGWSTSVRNLLEILPRPAPPPTGRRRWLAVYNEPTPYVVAKLDAVEERGSVSLHRVWLGTDLSQRWGADVSHGGGEVVPEGRPWLRLLRSVNRQDYSGVHVGGWGGDLRTLSLLGSAWLARVPLVIESDTHVSHATGWRRVARRLLLRTLDRRVRAWLPGGTPQARHLQEAVCPSAPVVVERMTTDTKRLLAESAKLGAGAGAQWRRAHGITEETALVLFVGRLAPEKGVRLLSEAVKELRASGRSLRLVLAGPGEIADFVPAGKGEWILHLGRVSWSELVPLYLAADVCVLPSLREPWGLVVNEALLLGCPMVVSDAVGAAEDLVRGPGAGVVVPSGDVGALADAIARVLDGGARNSTYAAAGRLAMEGWRTDGAARRVEAVLLGAEAS